MDAATAYADAAPIGRVLDAGADAVVIAMIESADQAAAAVAATRYPPAGIRSFGPLRASMGFDSAAPRVREGKRLRDDRNGNCALSGLSEICAVDGLAGIYVGPADLVSRWVMSTSRRGSQKSGSAGRDRADQSRRRDAGLVTGIHAEVA